MTTGEMAIKSIAGYIEKEAGWWDGYHGEPDKMAREILDSLTRAGLIVVTCEALGEAWDDGNASGLDGWIGPGRGAGEVDNQAVYNRERCIRGLL